jgi:hypothetical protein
LQVRVLSPAPIVSIDCSRSWRNWNTRALKTQCLRDVPVRFRPGAPRIVSSIGQSIRFLPGRLKVRVLHGPPLCLQRARSSRAEHSAFNRLARVRSPPSPPYFSIGASSSGRTSRFERENPGSNPGAPATRDCECHVNSAARVLACLARSHGFDKIAWSDFGQRQLAQCAPPMDGVGAIHPARPPSSTPTEEHHESAYSRA